MSRGGTSSKDEEESLLAHFNARTFVSGGLAGSVAKTLVAPIDRVKILLQVHSTHYEGYSIFSTFYQVVRQEGPLALYNGNGAQLLRIFPYAAMQFTSYELYKSLNRRFFGEKSNRVLNSVACGSLAGITAVTVTYPLDVIRSRLAFQYRTERIYKGILDSIRKIYREKNSVFSFYRGYSITILGMIPYAGISFSSFERFKSFIINNATLSPVLCTISSAKTSNHNKNNNNNKIKDDKNDETHKYYELNVGGKLVSGAMTGIIAQTVTYPVDVVRRHMQLATMVTDAAIRQKMGIIETMLYVYNKYGIVRGLYRGITLNYIRAVPMVSTSFCFYELSKKFLGLETGVLVKLS